MNALFEFLQAALAVPAMDWFSRAVDVAQILLVPIASGLLVFAWDTWKKVGAVWGFCFGEPHRRDDRGIAGLAEILKKGMDRNDRDLDRLYEREQMQRSPRE